MSHGLFQWLSGEVSGLVDQLHGQGPERETRGDAGHPPIEITIGNMECVKKDLVQLQQQLWDAAFSGCLQSQAQ